jgi:hypothetical protein
MPAGGIDAHKPHLAQRKPGHFEYSRGQCAVAAGERSPMGHRAVTDHSRFFLRQPLRRRISTFFNRRILVKVSAAASAVAYLAARSLVSYTADPAPPLVIRSRPSERSALFPAFPTGRIALSTLF